eukprot:5758856-Pleurochrysis_carterae.AAC.2
MRRASWRERASAYAFSAAYTHPTKSARDVTKLHTSPHTRFLAGSPGMNSTYASAVPHANVSFGRPADKKGTFAAHQLAAPLALFLSTHRTRFRQSRTRLAEMELSKLDLERQLREAVTKLEEASCPHPTACISASQRARVHVLEVSFNALAATPGCRQRGS